MGVVTGLAQWEGLAVGIVSLSLTNYSSDHHSAEHFALTKFGQRQVDQRVKGARGLR